MKIDVGERVSEDLKVFIKKWLKWTEIKNIALKMEFSPETARLLIAGKITITEKNQALLIDILVDAIEKRNTRKEEEEKERIKDLETIKKVEQLIN